MDVPAATAATAADPPDKRSFIPIILTIVGLTIGAALLIVRMERKQVMANWAARRCEIPIMFAGALYKPADDPRTAGQFSSDNFQYCIKELQKSAIGAALTAPMKLFSSQVDAANSISESQTSDKLGIARLLKGVVVQIMEDFYGRLRIFGDQFSRIIQRFRMAYERVAGAVNSIALLGISMMQGIFNAYNTIILVVIVILSIIAGVFIVMFFILFPLVPLLMSVIGVLTGAGFGPVVGPLESVFCFSGDTLIAMADGSAVAVADLQLGQIVAGDGVVEGVFEMDGGSQMQPQPQMYQLGDAVVSGDHLVYNDAAGAYCSVRDHPSAIASATHPARVFCPIISNRSLRTPGGQYWFRDWEEIEPESESAWHSLIATMLGSSATESAISKSCGVTADFKICTLEAGWISIRDAIIGHSVLTNSDETMTYTRILGTASLTGEHTGAGIGGGTWISDPAGSWSHFEEPAGATVQPAVLYNLITATGTLLVEKGGLYFIRDALEVGVDRIADTYAFTMAELLKTDSHPPNR
jgi:hypothetical protein